jgi:hypothetical protein
MRFRDESFSKARSSKFKKIECGGWRSINGEEEEKRGGWIHGNLHNLRINSAFLHYSSYVFSVYHQHSSPPP